MIKIHHLNCGSFCPNSSLLPTSTLSCHCLLLESDAGLILVDSGLPHRELSARSKWLREHTSRPTLKPGESAHEQVQKLGFQVSDVQHIIITHLDWDHIGGLSDFPEATVHMHALEKDTIVNPGRFNFRFDKSLWANSKKIQSYERFGESWNGLRAVRQLKGLPPEILLVPLAGHTRGHSGIAIDLDRKLLHAGDSFFFKEDLAVNMKDRNLASDLLQTALSTSQVQRLSTLAKLTDFHLRQPEIELINSHDPRLFPGK